MILKKIITVLFVAGSMLFTPAHSSDLINNSNDPKEEQSQKEPVSISFTMNAKGGAQGTGGFHVLLSKNFKGGATAKNINRAKWIDITDRFTLPKLETGDEEKSVFTKVSADISDLLSSGDTYTIAFQQIVKDQTAHGAQSQIRIRNFEISKGDAGKTLVDHTKAEWELFTKGKFRPNRPNISTSQIVLRGNHGKALNYLQAETEAWVISKPQTLED